MLLLIDECCGKGLVTVAESLGHTALRTVLLPALGRKADDADIWAYAETHGAIVVTCNQDDFLALAKQGNGSAGLILVPSIPIQEMAKLFRAALRSIGAIFAETPGAVLRLKADGAVEQIYASDSKP